MQTLEIRKKIITKISSSDGLNVVPLFTYTPYVKLGYRILGEYITIQNLALRSFIYSLPVVDFPTFELTASDSEVQLQSLQIEWNSPRYHLNLLMKDNDTDWTRIGVTSILNSSPAPYREFELGDHQLGDNGMIGFQVQNVGHGILTGSDVINISADLVRTISLEKTREGIASTQNLTALNLVRLLAENTNREGYTIFNNSELAYVYIDITNAVSLESYMIQIPPKGYYESVFGANSAIYAISDNPTTLYIREFT